MNPQLTIHQTKPDGTPAEGGISLLTFPSTAMRLVYTPGPGEMVFDSQQQQLYVGDGATAGGRTLPVVPVGSPGAQFLVNATLTAAAAATPVVLLTDAQVGTGKAIYITLWFVSVAGATAWADGASTIVKITDSAGTVAITFAKAGLTGKALLVMGSANTTYADLIPNQTGFAAGKGMQVLGDGNFGAGDNLKVTVVGYIK